MSTPEDWYKSQPPITRCGALLAFRMLLSQQHCSLRWIYCSRYYFTAALATTVLVSLNVLDVRLLILDFDLVFGKFQVRLHASVDLIASCAVPDLEVNHDVHIFRALQHQLCLPNVHPVSREPSFYCLHSRTRRRVKYFGHLENGYYSGPRGTAEMVFMVAFGAIVMLVRAHALSFACLCNC